MDRVISTRNFNIDNISHTTPQKYQGYYSSSVVYDNKRCILQTPKCTVLKVDWEKEHVILQVPSTKFMENVRDIDSSHVEFAKTLKGTLFSKDVPDDTFKRMFRPSFSAENNTLCLRFKSNNPFRVFDDSNKTEEVPIEEFKEGRIVNVMFEVRGIGFGNAVYGGTWTIVQARVQIPTPEPSSNPIETEIKEETPVLEFDDEEDNEGLGWTAESVQNETEEVPVV